MIGMLTYIPDQIICVGEVRPEAPADVPDTAVPLTIAVGHTGTEALSAWLARAVLTSAESVPIDGLIEIATLREEEDPEGALDTVRLALRRASV